MSLFVRNRQFLLVAALAALALRALTPAGYMPGSADSGLLYELCPEGMPVAITRALAGGHHHHGHGSDAGSVSTGGSEQCPIGHMLASAVATDTGAVSEMLPDLPGVDAVSITLFFRTQATAYKSRAPPARTALV